MKKQDKGLLAKAAEAIGSAAGTVAAKVTPSPKTAKAEGPGANGKFPKKHKSRLPRKQKKALQKRAAQTGA